MWQYLRQPGAKRYLGWSLRGLAMATGLVSAIALVYLPSLSQPTLRAKIVEIAGQPDNTAVIVEGVAAKSGNEVISGQHVTTPAQAKVSFQLTDALRDRTPQATKPTEKSPQATSSSAASAGFRLGQQSSFVLDNECVQLESGRAVVAGMQGCIGTIVIDTHNGIYTLERSGYLAEIKVLSGQVQISIPSNPGMQPIALKASQKITIDLTGDEIGPVRRMLPPEVQGLITGELFQGFQVPLPQQDTIAGLKPKPTAVVPVPQPVQPSAIGAQPAPSESVDDHTEIEASDNSAQEEEIAAIRDRNIAAARRRRLAASSDDYSSRRIPAWVISRRQRASSYEPPTYDPPAHEPPAYNPPAAPVAASPDPSPVTNPAPVVSEPPAPVPPPVEQHPTEPPVSSGEAGGSSPTPIDPPSGGNTQPESPVVVPGV